MNDLSTEDRAWTEDLGGDGNSSPSTGGPIDCGRDNREMASRHSDNRVQHHREDRPDPTETSDGDE